MDKKLTQYEIYCGGGVNKEIKREREKKKEGGGKIKDDNSHKIRSVSIRQ